MIRHASAEDLASLDLDGLTSRKAARVRRHVAVCVKCTQLSIQVSAVSTVLASVPYPSMSSNLTAQLDTTLASESARRLADAPATEAGRRDLPERRAQRSRGSWQLPGLSVLATRLVAAAGAVAIVGVGGYEIAAHTGGGPSGTAASSGSAAVPSARQVTRGPSVKFGPASSVKTIQTVHSGTNFTAADLGAQALAAVRAAKLEGAGPTRPAAGPAPTNTGLSANTSVHGQSASRTSLAGCLDRVVGSQPVQLVDMAKFEGKPATIIVTAQTAAHTAQVWAVGSACSATNPDVLAHQTLSRT